jgi:hypothetical protein
VLLDHGLADEVVLLVNPIVLGKGKRFFEGGSLPRGFALGSTMALPSGILVNVYKLIPTLAEEAVSRAKLEREFEIAREVQERLFPQTFPNVAGVEMPRTADPPTQSAATTTTSSTSVMARWPKQDMRPAKTSLPPAEQRRTAATA